MRRTIALSLASLALLAMTMTITTSFGAEGDGPPQFITFPILTRVAPQGLEHGHFVFGGDVGIPAPLAPNLGTANYSPATFGTLALSAGADVNVSASPDSYEGETGAASNGTVLVGGSNHIYPGNCSAAAAPGTFGDCAPLAYVSSNGSNWTKTALPRTWNNTTFGIGFDPAVDYDTNGTFYYSYGVAPLGGSYPNAVVVMKSTNNSASGWTPASPVTFNQSRFFDDKYYIAVDRSTSAFQNRIYVAWDRNTSTNQILYVAYSSNGGSSWSAPIKVDDGATKFERVIGAYPAVAQQTAGGVGAGTVFVSWHNYAKNKIYVDKSTNGGASWGTDVVAATTHTGFGKDIGCVGGRSQGPAHHLKVGPSGTLHLVYADQVTGKGFDILYTRSTNGGASWSTPVSLNDDGGSAHQFHPTLSVTSNGAGGDTVTVTFYDRRDDPSNCASHVYATQSTNNGASWSANAKVTTAPSNFNGNANGPGDYSSSAPTAASFLGGAGAWPFFSDHRTSNPETASGGAFDVYTAKVQ